MFPLADAPARPPPDSQAIVQGERRWTWCELDRRSAAWTAHLRERGVQSDDLVAVGVYRAGATPAPLSSKQPLALRDAILAVMRPAVFVDGDDSDAPLPEVASAPVAIAQNWKSRTRRPATMPARRAKFC